MGVHLVRSRSRSRIRIRGGLEGLRSLAPDSLGRNLLLVAGVVGVYTLTSPWCGAWALGAAHVLRFSDPRDTKVAGYLAVAALGAVVAQPWTTHQRGFTAAGVVGLGFFLLGWWGALSAALHGFGEPEAVAQAPRHRTLAVGSFPVGRVGRARAGMRPGVFVVVEEDRPSGGWRLDLSVGDPRLGTSVDWQLPLAEPADVDKLLGPRHLDVEWLDGAASV